MHTTLRLMTAAAATAVVGLGTCVPAHADPIHAKDAFFFQVFCDNGQTYGAIANGNGTWTPAHDLSSPAVLVPVTFGEITFTVSDSEGNILDQETSPPTSKSGAAAHNKNATTACDFAGSSTDSDGITFTLAGSVRGFVTK
jgi:hypothetical protein